MKFIKYTLIIICFFLFCLNSDAQKFEQIYNFPQYFNSAFTGYKKCSSVIIANNFHPISTGLNFFSNNLTLELYIHKFNSGLKFDLNKTDLPQNIISNTNFSFAYAYHIKINKKNFLSLSFQSNYRIENYNYGNLVFPDMISPFTNEITENNEIINGLSYNSLFIGTGSLFYNKNMFFSFFVNNFFLYSNYSNKKYTNNFNLISQKQVLKHKNSYTLDIFLSVLYHEFYYKFMTGILFKTKTFGTGIFSVHNYFKKNISNGLNTYFSVNYQKISIGYSFTFYYGILFNKPAFSQEINLKFRFNCTEKNKNNTIICPAYKL